MVLTIATSTWDATLVTSSFWCRQFCSDVEITMCSCCYDYRNAAAVQASYVSSLRQQHLSLVRSSLFHLNIIVFSIQLLLAFVSTSGSTIDSVHGLGHDLRFSFKECRHYQKYFCHKNYLLLFLSQSQPQNFVGDSHIHYHLLSVVRTG